MYWCIKEWQLVSNTIRRAFLCGFAARTRLEVASWQHMHAFQKILLSECYVRYSVLCCPVLLRAQCKLIPPQCHNDSSHKPTNTASRVITSDGATNPVAASGALGVRVVPGPEEAPLVATVAVAAAAAAAAADIDALASASLDDCSPESGPMDESISKI